jgi:hypothetical protein
MTEIWKDIKEFEGLYQVSNTGKVKAKSRTFVAKNGKLMAVPEIEMKPQNTNSGYLRVALSKSGKVKKESIHRLVAKNFLEINEQFNVVDHIDSNRKNNNLSNLRWCTQKENINFFLKKSIRTGESAPNSKLTFKDVCHIKNEINKLCDKNKNYIQKIANGYKVSIDSIYRIKTKKYWRDVK